MALTPDQGLAVAVLIYFSFAGAAATHICIRRGLGLYWGWLYLVLLSLIKIVSASLLLAYASSGDRTLAVASRILGAAGVMPLLLVMLELLQELTSPATDDNASSSFWSTLHWLQWVAFILWVVGLSISNDGIIKAVSVIVAVMFAIQVYFGCSYARLYKEQEKSFRCLTVIILASTPFVAVRLTYSLLSAFVSGAPVWDGSTQVVLTLALMQNMPEFVAVAMYLVAGIFFQMTKRESSKSETLEDGTSNH